MARIKLRVLFDGEHSIGPGKVQLLEAVRETGSISAAARSMAMAYRHAWVLIDDLNRLFGAPVVVTETGGRRGGGAQLTPLGRDVVRHFRAMERRTVRAVAADLRALEARIGTGVSPLEPAARRPGRRRSQ